MNERPKRFIVIRRIVDGKEVERIETTGHMERVIDSVMAGVLINMDKEKFYCCDEGEDGRPWQARR